MNFFFILVTALCSIVPLQSHTSSSDTEEYTILCQTASTDPLIFAQFKNMPAYTTVLEHVSFGQGWSYLNIILQQTPTFLEKTEAFRTNDTLGHPTTYYYPQIKQEISPTTLRYMKVASDLLLRFGEDLSQFSIIEIGGGYGGQCKILSDLFPLKNYTIVDLPSVIALSKRYLGEFGVKNVTFATHEESIQNGSFDLVISNYAFCECSEEMQKKYISEILSRSKRGYLTCNRGFEGTTKETLLKRLSEAHIEWREYPEIPLTAPDNYLLIWE